MNLDTELEMNLHNELEMNLLNELCETILCQNSAEMNLQNNVQKNLTNNDSLTKTIQNHLQPCEDNLVYQRKLVFGSFHQGDTRFSSFSRGSQCTCNALTMLIKCYEGFSFTTEFLDSTLIAGDQVYTTVVKSLMQKKIFHNKLLNFDELPSNLTLGENHHVIHKFDTIWGLVVSGDQNSPVKSLHQALDEAFQISRYLLIMIGAICSGVYKMSNTEYYFFDSHSHDNDGMSACEGKSVLVMNKGLDDLVTYLYNMYNSMHIDFSMQFEILPISISTLHHSFPERDPLQKKLYKIKLKMTLCPLSNVCGPIL